MTEPSARPTGRAAVAAGVLLFAAVAAELVWTVQRPDGSVTNLAGFALYLTAWTAGAAALLVALLGLGGSRSVAGRLSRGGRIGRGIALTGAVLLVAFGALGLLTALVSGAPAEWSFLLFAVGLLLIVVGAVPLALGLRRAGGLGGRWVAVLVAGAGGLVALGAAVDPWHDLGLFLFDAAWVAVGLRLLRAPAPIGREVTPAGCEAGLGG
jgi:hypothetical protein